MTKRFPHPSVKDSDLANEFEKKAFKRDWIAQRLCAGKLVGSGIVGAVMTLPMLAAAQGGGTFVNAASIDGVEKIEVMQDGSAQIRMNNGVTISVPAGDVQIAANGEILVSDRIVDIATEVMAAGGGGVGLAGLAVGGLAAAGAAAALGGGGGGGGGGGNPEIPVLNAQALDANGVTNLNTGIILPEGTASATVIVSDTDGNELFSGAIVPDEDGNWGFTPPEGTFPQGIVSVTVISFDEDEVEIETSTQDFLIDTIEPIIEITDLGVGPDGVLNIAEQTGGITITGTTDAEDGQAVVVSVDGETFVTVANGGTWSVTLSASDLAALADGASVAVTADVEDAAGNPAMTATEQFVADLTPPSIAINAISGDNQVGLFDAQGDLEITGTTDAEVGQQVTLTFDGDLVTGTGTVTGAGVWSVTVPQSVIEALRAKAEAGDGTLSDIPVTASVSDAAGNFATAITTIDADFNGPSITIEPVTGDNIVNALESGDDITISGGTNNVPDGQTVTVTVGGESFTVSVLNGGWQVTLTPAQAASAGLIDGATITVTADVSDGETDAPQASRQVTADFTAPTLTIDTIAGDDIINLAESGQSLVISGTSNAEEGQIVTLTVPGVTGPVTATVDASGTWEATLTATQTGELVAGQDGQSVTIIADVSDLAGNPALAASREVSIDTTSAPSVTIDTPIAGDDVLNIAERDVDLEITGTASGTDEVTVTINGAPLAPVAVTGGVWTVTIPTATLADLPDGESIALQADASNSAGNSAQATASFSTDFTAPTITFYDPPPAGFVLNLDELQDVDGIDFTTSETTGANVTLTFTRDGGGVDFTRTALLDDLPQDDGVFIFPLTPEDLGALADETGYTVDITITDAAGNTGIPDSFDLTTDFRPFIALDEIGVDGAVDVTDTADASISGTTIGVEDGQEVSVTVTGSAGTAFSGTAAVTAGVWAVPVPESAFDALQPGETFTVTATVSNQDGREAEQATVDFDAYLASAIAFVNAETVGSTITVEAFALDGFNSNDGLQTKLSFDPSEASFVPGSTQENPDLDLFIVNEDNAGSGSVIFSGGTTSTPLPPEDDLFSFEMTDQGTGPITLTFEDEVTTGGSQRGGSIELIIGTGGADTLTASNIDSVIRGAGGDDMIDVSATGFNVVIFELDQASNGTDTVMGFTTGTSFQADEILIWGEADLRGEGDLVEALAAGGTLGVDTGFVIFTTALVDTDVATLETAFEGLVGETAGDVVYFLAGDGTDAALARATVNGTDNATLEIMANFVGIGDLALLNPDNVVLPDPVSFT
ncbi:MAG: Ig-like domain-containing protein [Roseovarius sp.]